MPVRPRRRARPCSYSAVFAFFNMRRFLLLYLPARSMSNFSFDLPAVASSSLPMLPNGMALSVASRGGVLGVGSVGLGGKLWPAASALCRWLRAGEPLDGKTVFELGCGTGAVGLYAAALGAGEVVMTDGGGEQLLSLARQNVESNRALLERDRVTVAEHTWGQRDLPLPPRIDLVLGSDVTYSRQSHAALCTDLRWLLSESASAGSVVLAHQRRALLAPWDATPIDHGFEHFRKIATANGLNVQSLQFDRQLEVELLGVSLVEDRMLDG